MERSYTAWMKAIKTKKEAYPNLNLVIRHDIDFDIKTARRMMEIEREFGLNSVIYVDVHNPNYGIEDIQALYRDFSPTFPFGLHINVAYDHENRCDCYKAFLEDLDFLIGHDILVNSCAGHYYNTSIVPLPEFTNVDVERLAPSSTFLKTFFKGEPKKLGDGGGVIARDVTHWIDDLDPQDEAFLQIHPVHYASIDNDVKYTQSMGLLPPHAGHIAKIQDYMKEELTPYLAAPIEQIFHLRVAVDLLREYATENYKRLLTVVDAGCGIGLMAAYLAPLNNVKYIGFDKSSSFVSLGIRFHRKLGYEPVLYCGDFYDHEPCGDILCFLGYEDCPTDYHKMYKKCLGYKDVLITIASKRMVDDAAKRGKHYHFIEEEVFEGMFLKGFRLVYKVPSAKRILYWWERI